METKKKQIGGSHYSSMKIQPVEYIRANGLDYFEGNVVKYISRYRKKNGIQDLLKARHYIDMIIDYEYSENCKRYFEKNKELINKELKTFSGINKLIKDTYENNAFVVVEGTHNVIKDIVYSMKYGYQSVDLSDLAPNLKQTIKELLVEYAQKVAKAAAKS